MAVRRLLKNVHAKKVGRFIMRFAPVVKVFRKPLKFASKYIKRCLRISTNKSLSKSKFRESELGIRRLAVVRAHELGEVRAISNGHFRSLIQLHVMETPPSCRTHSYYNLHTVLRNLSFTSENGRDLNMIARVLNLQITAPFLEQVLKIQQANRVSVELFSGYFGTCFDSNHVWRVKTPLHRLQALSAEELKACADYDMATSSAGFGKRPLSDPNHDDEMPLQNEQNGSPTKSAACRFSKLFLTSATEQIALLYESHSYKVERVEQNQAENIPVPESLGSSVRQLQLKVNRLDDSSSSFQQRPFLQDWFLGLDRAQNQIGNTKAPCSSLKENKDLSLKQLPNQLSRHAEPMVTDEAAEDVQPPKRHRDNSSGVVQSVVSCAQDRRLEELQNKEANANPSNSFSEENYSLVEDSLEQMSAGSTPEKDRSNSDLEEKECCIARGISVQAATVKQPPALNQLRLSLRTAKRGSSCLMAFHEGTPIHYLYSDSSDALTVSFRNHRNLSDSETLDDAQRVFSLTDPKNRSLDENPDMKIDPSLPRSMQVSESSYAPDSTPCYLGKVSMTGEDEDIQITSESYRENESNTALDSGELRIISKVKGMNRNAHALHGRFEVESSNSPKSRKPGKAHTTDINQDVHSLLTNKRKRSLSSDVGSTKPLRKSQKTKNADVLSSRSDLIQKADVSLGKRPQRLAKINAKVKLNTRRRSS